MKACGLRERMTYVLEDAQGSVCEPWHISASSIRRVPVLKACTCLGE